MLLIWARVIILGYMAVNESNHWHKACAIGGAVPISTIANRATTGWRLHQQQQQQNEGIRERWRTKSKMKLRPSTFVMSMVMAQTRYTTVHSPSHCLFLSDGGDNNSNIVSFDFRVMIPGKNIEHAQIARSNPPRASAVYMHVQCTFGSSYLGVLIWSRVTRSDFLFFFFRQIKVSTWTE